MDSLPPTPRPRRTLGQRLLLAVGGVLAATVLLAAGVVAWAGYKINQIDREDVVLDALVEDGPTNYLIVGSDSRSGGDPDQPGSTGDGRPPLADTIMVLRVDPGATTAQVLSLPRDLWVTTPDGKEGRINAAYAKGPQALIDTLRNELDIPINHYIEVDFQGFQELVGAIDGVPMWFDRAMRDTNSGLDVLHPGCVVLDGQSALAFARARHLQYWEDGGFTYDGTGDLGRISRQQVFLRRVIDRARTKGLSNPLTLKALVDVATAHLTIDTQLPVSNLAALGRRFSSFDSDELETYTIPVAGRTTSGGAQVVELDPVGADAVLDQFRNLDADGTEASTTTVATGSIAGDDDLADPAAVTVTVLNSSGEQGLAQAMANALVADGFTVDSWGNGADLGHALESVTVIRYPNGYDRQARTVAAAMKTDGRQATLEQDSEVTGVVVFLGSDASATPGTGSTSSSAPATSTSTTAPSATTTTAPLGIVPGDPPAGSSCG